MGWNEGVSLADLWGQITQQLWRVPRVSHGREEQDVSCLVADAPCPAAVLWQEAGLLVAQGLRTSL